MTIIEAMMHELDLDESIIQGTLQKVNALCKHYEEPRVRFVMTGNGNGALHGNGYMNDH